MARSEARRKPILDTPGCAVLAILTVFVGLLVLSSPRLDGFEEAVETFIGNSLLAICNSAAVREAAWLVYRLVTFITDGELGYHIQKALDTDNWPSNLLAPNWSSNDLLALIIFGGLGAFFAWQSWAHIEGCRLVKAMEGCSAQEIKRKLEEQPLPPHPGAVFLWTALSAVAGLWAVQDMGWPATVACTVGLALVWMVIVVFALGDAPGADALPQQTAYGDAHWATLDEVLEKTSLLDGDD
jgi:hypothetical protein